MSNVLVLGGNSYFGKKLVNILLQNNHDVTILNRGNQKDGFGSNVLRIKCDRTNEIQLKKAIVNKYDIVFDQCCFDYEQAKLACEVFKDKTNKYIFTSSVSAYNEYGKGIKEELFDPYTFKFNQKHTKDSNYGEAKRQAEVAFYKYATFPVTALRFPIVLDAFDKTDRLQLHVKKIKNKEPIYFKNLDAEISFISAKDAAKALYELAFDEFDGPINVASSKPIKLSRVMSLIEKVTAGQFILSDDIKDMSPYAIEQDWTIDCTKLNGLGINLDEIEDYLPEMLEQINQELN